MKGSIKEIWLSKAELSEQFFKSGKARRELEIAAVISLIAFIIFLALSPMSSFFRFVSLIALILVTQAYVLSVYKQNIYFYSSLKYKQELMDEKLMEILRRMKK